MNSHQRRKHMRKMQLAFPIGTRVIWSSMIGKQYHGIVVKHSSKWLHYVGVESPTPEASGFIRAKRLYAL